MTLRQHQHLRWWLPLFFAIAVFVFLTIADEALITTPIVWIPGVVSFIVLQFAVGLLPAECPKCGGRLRFQRSLDFSERSNVVWHEYYCFQCKKVITWERSQRSSGE